MNILYSNGSSTTYGLDLIKPKSLKMTPQEYKKKHTYTGQLEKILNFERSINAGEPGSPNSNIIRRTVHDITQLLQTENSANIFVCLALSPATPIEFYLREQKRFFNLIFPEKLLLKIKDDPEYKSEQIKQMYHFFNDHILSFEYLIEKFLIEATLIQNFLQNKKINFILFHTAPIISSYLDEKTKFIDFKKDVNLTYNKKMIQIYFQEKNYSNIIDPSVWIDFNENSVIEHCVIKNNMDVGKTGHILEEGHLLWAHYLSEKIKHVYRSL